MIPGGRHLLALYLVLGALGIAMVIAAGWSVPERAAAQGWFPFSPGPLVVGSPIDLRSLNEARAGEKGFIQARDGAFVHGNTGRSVRFWGVNVTQDRIAPSEVVRCASLMGHYGVNLARIHGPVYDGAGEIDPARVERVIEMVEAFEAEGIYSHLSIYWWAWLKPRPGTPWLRGYDGKTDPVAALFFNPDFQAQYRKWWAALLLTPSPRSGRRLVDDPAVAGLEIQNEDSLLFWTFEPDRLPEPQLRILEGRFAEWLLGRHRSLEAALSSWPGRRMARDDPEAGRIAIRPLDRILKERTARDQETVRFLVELQTRFYSDTYAYLRGLGFRGVIGASNWKTASPELLDPLEAMSYAPGDFSDRHAYLGCDRQGPDAAWALRRGQIYTDRSALRLDAGDPSAGATIHPGFEPRDTGKPTMLSEVSWERPNRNRSEALLSLAVLGSLQGSDAIVHFALDGCDWSVSPRPEVQQPWTLASPAMLGQFPAVALLFRRGLVASAARGPTAQPDRERLMALAGDSAPSREGWGSNPILLPTSPGDPATATLVSSTGEIVLDRKAGLLRIDAPSAQGVGGSLRAAGVVETRDLTVSSNLDVGHLVVVSLDDRPLATSRRMLLQVMSEERPSGFDAEPLAAGSWRILDLGMDPWLVRAIEGEVRFRRADADRLAVVALDLRGEPVASLGDARSIRLLSQTVYYLIERR